MLRDQSRHPPLSCKLQPPFSTLFSLYRITLSSSPPYEVKISIHLFIHAMTTTLTPTSVKFMSSKRLKKKKIKLHDNLLFYMS